MVQLKHLLLGVMLILLPLFAASDTSQSDNDIIVDDGDIVLDDDDIVLDDSVSTDELPPIEKMPEQTFFFEAYYPESLYSRGIEGAVVLELLVNEHGLIDSSKVVQGFHPFLDSCAQEASLRFEFTPAIVKGDSVPVYIQYEYRFSMDKIVKEINEYENFTGQVIERGTRKPVAEATVALLFTGKEYSGIKVPLKTYLERIGNFEGQELEAGVLSTTTDANGFFRFKSLPVGEVTVKLPITGYEVFQTTDTITSGEKVESKYYVTRLSYNDYEVVAYYKGEEKEVSRRKMTISEVKKVPGLGGDAIKVVQALPGVARPAFASGEVIIRGAYTYDSKFLLNELEIPQLYHFGGLKSVYNSEALEEVEFFPGGWGTTYGGAIGGIVNIRARKAARDRWHGLFDISTLDGSFFVEGPINKKVSVMASARRSYFGEIVDLVLDNMDNPPKVSLSPFYWDYIVRTDVELNEKHSVYLTEFGAFDSLEMKFGDMESGSSELTETVDQIKSKTFFNHLTSGWTYKINDRFTNEMYQGWINSKNRQSFFGQFVIDLSYNSWIMKDNLAFKLNDKVTFNTGLDIEYSNVDVIIELLGEYGINRDSLPDMKIARGGAYANAEIRPNKRLLLIPGIRYDHYKELFHRGSLLPEFKNYDSYFDNTHKNSGDPSIRFSTRYKLTPKHTLKAALGNYNQTPQPIGQAIHPTYGNPALPTTKASHFVVGDEWQITDLISLDLQGFYNNQWDIPRYLSKTELSNNNYKIGDPTFVANGKGRTFGLECMLRHSPNEKFFGWLAYTLSRSERWDPVGQKWDLFERDQTHNLQILGSWKLPRNWEVGGRMRVTTGNPTTPIVGVNDESINSQGISPKKGETNSARLDPFFQLDFRVEKKFIKKYSIWTTYLDFQNLSYLFGVRNGEFITNDDFYLEESEVAMVPVFDLGFSFKF